MEHATDNDSANHGQQRHATHNGQHATCNPQTDNMQHGTSTRAGRQGLGDGGRGGHPSQHRARTALCSHSHAQHSAHAMRIGSETRPIDHAPPGPWERPARCSSLSGPSRGHIGGARDRTSLSPVPVQMWQRRAWSRCRCGSGEPGLRLWRPLAAGSNPRQRVRTSVLLRFFFGINTTSTFLINKAINRGCGFKIYFWPELLDSNAQAGTLASPLPPA